MMNKQEAMDLCKKHLHRYVLVHMADGTSYDGIVEHVDDDHVYLAVPVGEAAAMGGYGDEWGPPGAYPNAHWPWAANANAPLHWGAEMNAPVYGGANMPAPGDWGAHANAPWGAYANAPWGAYANAPAPWGANVNAPIPYAAEANLGPSAGGNAPAADPNEKMASAAANVNAPGYGEAYRPDGFGYGYPGYGYGYGYGFPYYGYPFYGPRRRFRRLVLPLFALTALSLLPYY